MANSVHKSMEKLLEVSCAGHGIALYPPGCHIIQARSLVATFRSSQSATPHPLSPLLRLLPPKAALSHPTIFFTPVSQAFPALLAADYV